MKITMGKSKSDPVSRDLRFIVMVSLSCSLVIFGMLVDTPINIYNGLINILTEPDTLVTDYIGLGGMGAAFVNSGILTLIFVLILYKLKIAFNGTTFAALFLTSGFAFFGKNIFNVWFIVLGVYFYAKYQKDSFSKYVYVAMFGTAMAPMVSELLFAIDSHWIIRTVLGVGTGIFIGFILPPLATYLLRVHQGFNLYNIGFAAGILGTVIVSVYKSYGFIPEARKIWSTGNNKILAIYLLSVSLIMIISGFILNGKSFRGIRRILKYPGRLVTDFTILAGSAPTMINMGINGVVSTLYVIMIGGDLNGATIAGIFTVIGFGALGKHVRNMMPIVIGVSLGAITKVWGINDPAIQLAALFGTGLSPIAGEFGWKIGILAGFVHSSVVLNVGVLHGGINLYNNGFAAGIVAAVLVPIIEALRKDEI